MKIEEIARCIGATVLQAGSPGDRVIRHVYAGDRISDLIERSTAETLLVTNISNAQLIRVAELMDVPGICVTGGVLPDPALLSAASRTGTAILAASEGLFETCGRLYRCMGGEGSQA
jgi:hypothetical protein